MIKLQENKSGSLHALLIGSTAIYRTYFLMEDITQVLEVCVSDINRIENFLTQKVGLDSNNIMKLTASNTGKTEPPEPSEKMASSQ